MYDSDVLEYFVIIKERVIETKTKEEQENHEERLENFEEPGKSDFAKGIGAAVPDSNAPEIPKTGEPMDSLTIDNITDSRAIFY